MLLRALHSLQRGAGAAAGGSTTAAAATAAAAATTTTTTALRRWMASNDGSSADADAANGNAAADAHAAQLSQMLDVMLKDDSARDMLLSRLPERMRRPEVVRAMLQNPEVRARLGQLAQSMGLGGGGGGGGAFSAAAPPFTIINTPDAAELERGLAAARAAGIDPGKVAARLASSPALRSAAASPRVLAALMDICRRGPEAARDYEGDQEVLRAYFEAGAALQEAQAESSSSLPGGGGDRGVVGAAGAGAAAAAADASGAAAAGENEAQAAASAALRALAADPALAAKLSSPRVRAALEDIAKSPLKAVKYLFDSEVREALAAARRLIKDGGGGDGQSR